MVVRWWAEETFPEELKPERRVRILLDLYTLIRRPSLSKGKKACKCLG